MLKIIWVCIAVALHCDAVLAAVSLIGTRIVYPANAKFADITANNGGAKSAQMLAWVDDGDINSTPDTATAPFLLAPAVKVIGPGRKQVLRISYNGSPLPLDRETLYYLNVTEIPPRSAGSGTELTLQFSVRTRIKIFMRPAGLPGAPTAAAKKMSWELDVASGAVVIRATNPSPYFVSMASVKLMRGDAMLADLDRGMVPPWGTSEFHADTGVADLTGATAVNYVYVNDYGGPEEFTFPLPAR
jgi:chaperone protein EcpD